ncbi:vitamin B12 dependent methionine synthase [Halobacteroides halobius DSM 5150]|uniref:Vitamin B12 dependent methionine synthase n=1 Tax=Halobacteroides halobius (strain ATCC 35273 / DSM 5150 / MD-1) TaxID=748449 RepID=L0KAZ8_HALHC|nr:vitamin B12 dependent methionine synthase [Halobacteroides halobius]AGB41258.1 vitamin B12 dependent methionine synthase [Halobacteroides halobius DSM 5150]
MEVRIIIIKDISIEIPKYEVKKELGYQKQTESNSKIEKMISDTINLATSLLEPKGKYVILEKIDIDQDRISLGAEKLTFQSQDIADLLADQEEVALLAVTIGGKLEKKVNQLFTEGELTKATTLDAVGSAAVEEVANRITKLISEEALAKGLSHLTMRFSPGYGDTTLDIQPQLLILLGGEELGITLSSGYILDPQKSITALIGLGNVESDRPSCDFNCQNCEFEICVYDK